MRTYVLDLPAQHYSTPNSREHWARRAENAHAWRSAACLLARQAPALDRITVTLDYWPKDRRRRDRDNLVSGVLKHVLDGIVDAGVVPDDAPEYVDARMPVIHEPRDDRQAMWVLTVEAVA